jgi:hypothetical protein
MVMSNNTIESTITKNTGKSLDVLMTMQMQRYATPNGAHPVLHSKPLDVAIGRVPVLYRPGGRHGQIC